MMIFVFLVCAFCIEVFAKTSSEEHDLKDVLSEIQWLKNERKRDVFAMKEMQNELNTLKRDLINRNVRSIVHHKIAFSVQLSNTLSGLGNEQPIVFDIEETDTANAYSTSDGLYIVPVTGMYVFTWTLAVNHGRCIVSRLLKNGNHHGYSFVDSYGDGDFGFGTGLVVLQANAGDHLNVVVTGGDGIIEGGNYATFSGWLLYSDE